MALSTAYARAGLAAALFAVLGLLSPVGASVAIWTSGDGSRAVVRNASGRPVMIDVPKALPPISTSGGAGALRATQSLSLAGASAELGLSRAVSLAAIARGLRIASGIAGPVGMVGLAYEGIVWATDHWEASHGGQPPSQYLTGCTGPYPTQFTAVGQICLHQNLSKEYTLYYPREIPPAGWAQANLFQCSSYPQFCGGATSGSGAVGERARVACPGGGYADVAGQCASVGLATDAEVEQAFSNALQSDPSKAGPAIEWVKEAVPAYDFAPGPVEVTGPSSVQGPVETTTRQEGGNTYTTTNQTTYNLSFQGDTVTVTTTTNSTTVDQSNNVVSSTVTNTQASPSPQKAEEAVKPCGLPDTPPCKIDETGTPTGTGVLDAGLAALTTGFDSIKGGIESLGTSPKDSLGMALEFEPPTGSCSPLVLTYKDFSRSVDWCPTLETARAIWGWFIGILGALYVFRRATDPGL